MAVSSLASITPSARLPWSSSFEEDKRFLNLLVISFIVFFVIGVIVPMLKVPTIERSKLESLPPQLAKIVMEKKKLPPPPKPKPKPKPKEKKKEKPKEKKKEKKKKEKKKEKKKTVEDARKKAAVSGILAFADDLADMRDELDLNKLNKTDNLSRAVGAGKKIERSIITGRAGGTSGGISTAGFSRNVGGTALSGRETTVVEEAAVEKIKKRAKQADKSGRADESVRSIFSRNKGALDAIYRRALRKDPALEGKVTIRLVIQPDGRVTDCKIVSSELNNAALEAKLVKRIRLINFGSEKVAITTINYSLQFFPY